MSYFDDFKTLSTMFGNDSSEQSESSMQMAFDTYFAQSPNRVVVEIDGVETNAIIQHMKYGENFNDEKLLIIENESVCSIGSLVSWDGKTWIVANRENRSIKTHQTFKMPLCNWNLKWRSDNGSVITEPCVIYEGGLGFQDAARQVPETDARRKVLVRKNQNTLSIDENDRFILGSKRVFSVTDVDDFTTDGTITIRLEKTIPTDLDDFVNGIAYNGDIQYEPEPVNDVQLSTNEMLIIEGYTSTLTASIDGEPLTTFTFDISGLPTEAYQIISTTGTSIEIKCLDYYHEGTIKATSNTNPSQFAEIPIILRGLF